MVGIYCKLELSKFFKSQFMFNKRSVSIKSFDFFFSSNLPQELSQFDRWKKFYSFDFTQPAELWTKWDNKKENFQTKDLSPSAVFKIFLTTQNFIQIALILHELLNSLFGSKLLLFAVTVAKQLVAFWYALNVTWNLN